MKLAPKKFNTGDTVKLVTPHKNTIFIGKVTSVTRRLKHKESPYWYHVTCISRQGYYRGKAYIAEELQPISRLEYLREKYSYITKASKDRSFT